MTEISSCLVCGGTDAENLFTARDYLVSGEQFIVSKCKTCGFIFTANPPEEESAGRYYRSEDYISHSDRRQSLTEHLYHAARSLMLRAKYKVISRACQRKSGSLVDIGSGTGYFVHFMQKAGWKAAGIEINEEARNYSASKFGIRVLAPYEISSLPASSVDCITFWHVLEHLYDPAGWMREVKRILTDNGRCIIALPNIESADAEWFNNMWAALDVPRHLWHFSPDVMLRFVNEQGLACTDIIPMPLDVFYISVLSYKYKGTCMPLLRGIMTGMLLSAQCFFRKKGFSSLIYVISCNVG